MLFINSEVFEDQSSTEIIKTEVDHIAGIAECETDPSCIMKLRTLITA